MTLRRAGEPVETVAEVEVVTAAIWAGKLGEASSILGISDSDCLPQPDCLAMGCSVGGSGNFGRVCVCTN